MGAIVSCPESGDVETRDQKIISQAGHGLSTLFDDYKLKDIKVSEAFSTVFAEEWIRKQQFEKNESEGGKAKKAPGLWAKLQSGPRSSMPRVEDYACLEPSPKSLWEETNNKSRLQALLRTFAALVRAQGGHAHAGANDGSAPAPPRVEHLPRSTFAAPISAAALGSKDKFTLLRPFAALESLAAALSTAAAAQGQGQADALQATETILGLQAKTDKVVTAELLGGRAAFPLFGRAALAEPIFKHAQQLAASSKGPVRSAALALMLSVVLATGDLSSMLELAAALEAGPEALPPASLRQLAQLALEPGPMRCDLVVPAYPAVEAFKGQVFEHADQEESTAASLCTDGAHLFVWDGTRLLKIATGLLGTSQHGQVVAANETISTADVDSPYLSLALVGARLYLRSAKRTLVLSAFSLAEEGVAGPLEPAAQASAPLPTPPTQPTEHTFVCHEGQVLDVRCLPGGKMEVQSATLHGPDEALDVTASVAQLLQAGSSARLYFDYNGRAAVADMAAAAGGSGGAGGGVAGGSSDDSSAEADDHGSASHLSITITITSPPAGSVAMLSAPPALMASDGHHVVILTRSLVIDSDATAATTVTAARPYLEPQRDIRLTSAYFHEENFGGGDCLAQVQDLFASYLAGTLSPVVASEEAFAAAGSDKASKKNKVASFNHYPPALVVGDIVRRGPNWRYDAQDSQNGVRQAGVVISIEADHAIRIEWRTNVASPSTGFHKNKYWYRPNSQKYDVYKVDPANPEACPSDVAPPSGAAAGGGAVAGGGKGSSPGASSSSASQDDGAGAQVLFVNCLVGQAELCFAFPEGTAINFGLLLEAAARHQAGLKVVLSAVVLDPETRASATVPLQDSALSLSSLQRLGAETVLLFNGRLLLVQQRAGPCTFPSYLFDLGDKGKYLGLERNHFPKEIGTPAALAFDRRSNFVYSYDPATLLFQRWRNSGLPPTASLLSSSSSPAPPSAAWEGVISRGDAYECVRALLGEEEAAGAAGASSPRRQAVLLHALLAQRSQDAYAALSMRLPAAEADLRGMVVLSSRGRREDHKEVGHGISVRGVAPAVSLDDLTDVPAGYYVCALDGANFSDVLDVMLFDLTGEPDGSKGEEMANFIEDQEEGVVILITTVGDASCALTSRALGALRSIGLAAPDRLLPRKGKSQWPSGVCSLACIGRKGAEAGSAAAVIADGGDLVILKARIPSLGQPLMCDPCRPVLSSLTRRCVAAVDRIKRQGQATAPEPCDFVELVSCLKLLTVNISSLVQGTAQEAVLGVVDAETRGTLMKLLRDLIYPPLGGAGGRVIASCAMDAFFVCQSLVESAVSDQLAMLFSLLKEKHGSGGILSPELDMLLNLLLERLSGSDAIAKMLRDDAAQADTNNLVKALMQIVKDGETKRIEQLGSAGGGGAVGRGLEESSLSAAKLLYPLLLGLASKAVLLFVSSSGGGVDAGAGKKSQGSAVTQRAGLNLFFDVLSDVAHLSYSLVSSARECSDRVSPGSFAAGLDEIMQSAPVRKMLPTLLLSLSSLVSMYGPRMLALEQGRVVAVAEMILAGHRELLQVLALIPASCLHRNVLVETSVPVATTVTETVEAESEHNYAPNLNVRTQYEFKNATSIKVSMDPRCRTEGGCDWLCFQSVDGSEDYSPKYSGTNPSEWPGATPNGVAPFCLPLGVTAFSTMWHSDGSNEDWGWKFNMTIVSNVTSLEARTVEADVKHWAVTLAEQHELALAQLAGSLIAGRPLHAVFEDAPGRPGLAAAYMEDPVVSMQVLCPEVPPPYESEEERLLVDLIERPEGSLAHKLVAIMRQDKTLSDQGHDDLTIETVVYGTCAAAIKHNNLLHEALVIAKGTRVAQVSAPFKLAWKTSQKMRQYLLQPGINVEKRAEAILDKVRFLLRSDSRLAGEGADKGKADEARTSPTAAKQRWALLRQNIKTAASKAPSMPRRNLFGGIVSQLSVNERLQKLKRFRKRLAEKRPLSTTERVLQFLKDQNIEPSQLSQLLALRTSRAEARAHGFGLCCQLLQMRAAGNLGNGNGSTSTSTSTSSESDSGHAWTAHVCKAIRQSCTQAGKTHALSFLQGVSAAHTERVKEAYAAFLARCFALVEALPAPSPLAVGCLQACAMDHGVGDLRAINNARVVPILGALLSSPDEGLSTLADSLLQIVVPSGGSGGDASGSSSEPSASEDGGKFSGDVKTFAVSVGDVLSAKVCEMGRAAETISNLTWPEPQQQQQGERALGGVYSLFADTAGYSIPVATSGSISGGGRTYSCWIMRPARAALDDDASPLRLGDLVMRSVQWSLQGNVDRADEDGGVGGLGNITALKADGMAEVQWRCGGKPHTVSVRELTRACDSLGGHIFSQGTSALKEGGCTVGLALLPDASLCAFVSSGSPASFVTVRGRRLESVAGVATAHGVAVPPNQWVHVALTVTESAVCTIRVDGLVLAEEMLSVPSRTETKMFESAHPYRDNTDSYTIIAFPPQFKKFTVTFDPQTKTESRHDYVVFFKDASHSARYGKEKYSGRGDSRNFPGLEQEPALVIPSNSCEVFFHSDGSNNDWGWRLFAKAEIPGHTPKFNLCDGPVHLGTLPFFAVHSTTLPAIKCSMTGLVARLSVVDEDAGWEAALPDKVERPEIHKCAVNKLASIYHGGYQCDVCETDGNCSLSKVYHCEQCGWDCHARCMEAMLRPAPLVPPRDAITLLAQHFQLCVLDLLAKTVDLSAGSEADDSYVTDMRREMRRVLVSNPAIAQALLHVVAASTSPLLKSCAYKILARLLPRSAIPMVEAQVAASALAGSSSGGSVSVSEALLRQAGRLVALDASSAGGGVEGRRGERHAEEGIESSLLSLLRALAVSSYAGQAKESGVDDAGATWSAAVGAFIKAECGRVSALLESLRDAEAPMPQDRASLDAAYGLLAFLGGALQSACTPGARALYLREGALTEPCTVLAPAHVPAPSAESPSSASDAALWKDLNSFGEAVAVCLDSSPKKQTVVPAHNLRFVDQRPDDAHFSAFLAEHVGEEALCRLFERVTAIHVADSRPLLWGLSSKKDAVKEFESNHPYADNERFYQTITLDPSVKEVQISFSELCATEGGCDYLVFYKDSSHTSKWGKDKYSGRKGDACWKEPLTIPSHTFVVHFYSDGSNTDWGWKFKASYTQRMDVVPPSFPLDPLLLPRAHLKMVGAKALRSVLQSSEWFTRALARSHELSSAVISAALQPSSCLVLERELSRKCADVYLCSAAATGRTTTFTALSEAALHSCVYAQQMLKEGRRVHLLEAAGASSEGVLAGGGASQRSAHAVPRVLRLSGVQRDGKDDHAANGFYLEDLARGDGSSSSSRVVYRKAGASEAAGSKAGPPKRAFNHYPPSLEVGDLVRRGPDWSYGDQDKNGGVCCAGTVHIVNGDVISVKWVANVADIGNSFHDNNYYYKPQKFDVYKLNPENLGAYPPGEAPPVAPVDDAPLLAGGAAGAAAASIDTPSVIIANVTGPSEARINGTYHWNAAENHYEKSDKSMIIEYRVKKWQIKSYGKKGQNAAFASVEADSEAVSIWESKASLIVAKGEEWLSQPQAKVTRGPSSPGAAQYLEFVVTNEATGAGRWVVNEPSQLGTTAGTLFCEASDASLPMDPSCQWKRRTSDEPSAAGEVLRGVRAVSMAFPVESKPARGDFLAPVDAPSSAEAAETQAALSAAALVSKTNHIPTSFELSGYTGALADEVNGVWDLVPPHDKRRSEPQQQVLTKRGQALSIVYCPAVGKQTGCGPDCRESHSNTTCFSCGEGWGSHSGHSCTNNRGRGSFPSSSGAALKKDPQSRKFKIVRQGAQGKPLAELSVEAVLDSEGRLRIATPIAPDAAAAAAGAVPEDKPALNRAGVLMKPGSSSGTQVFYCGRQLGRDIVGQDSDGQCGPNNGPQCPDCRGFTLANPPEGVAPVGADGGPVQSAADKQADERLEGLLTDAWTVLFCPALLSNNQWRRCKEGEEASADSPLLTLSLVAAATAAAGVPRPASFDTSYAHPMHAVDNSSLSGAPSESDASILSKLQVHAAEPEAVLSYLSLRASENLFVECLLHVLSRWPKDEAPSMGFFGGLGRLLQLVEELLRPEEGAVAAGAGTGTGTGMEVTRASVMALFRQLCAADSNIIGRVTEACCTALQGSCQPAEGSDVESWAAENIRLYSTLHPLPAGTRITLPIEIPSAQIFTIAFDPRSQVGFGDSFVARPGPGCRMLGSGPSDDATDLPVEISMPHREHLWDATLSAEKGAAVKAGDVVGTVFQCSQLPQRPLVVPSHVRGTITMKKPKLMSRSRFTFDDVLFEVRPSEADTTVVQLSLRDLLTPSPIPPAVCIEGGISGGSCVLEFATAEGSWGFSCVTKVQEAKSRDPRAQQTLQRLTMAIRLLDCLYKDKDLYSLPALYSASLFDALVQAYASSPEAISCGLSDLLITITRAVLHAPTSALAAMPPSVLAALRAVKARTLGTLPSKKVGEPGDYHPETQAQAQLVIYLGEAMAALEGAQSVRQAVMHQEAEEAAAAAAAAVEQQPSWLPHLELSAEVMRGAVTNLLPEAVMTSRFLPLCSANARVVLEGRAESRSERVNVDSAEKLLVVLRSLALEGEGSVEVLDGAGRVVSVLADPVPSRAVRAGAIATFLSPAAAAAAVAAVGAADILQDSGGIVMVDGPSLTIRTRPGGHFKLEVIPRFALETARALTQFQPMLDALKLEFCGSPGTDAALVRYVNREAAKRGWTLQRLLSARWSELAPAEDSDELVKAPLLKALVSTMPLVAGLYSPHGAAAEDDSLAALASAGAVGSGVAAVTARRAVEEGGTIMRIAGDSPMNVREGQSLESTALRVVAVGDTVEVLPATLSPISASRGVEITRVQVAGGGWVTWRVDYDDGRPAEIRLEEVPEPPPVEEPAPVGPVAGAGAGGSGLSSAARAGYGPGRGGGGDDEEEDDDDLFFASFELPLSAAVAAAGRGVSSAAAGGGSNIPAQHLSSEDSAPRCRYLRFSNVEHELVLSQVGVYSHREPEVNAALGKAVTGSDKPNGTAFANIVDGNFGDRKWESGLCLYAANQSVTIDLGQSIEVGRIVVVLPDTYAELPSRYHYGLRLLDDAEREVLAPAFSSAVQSGTDNRVYTFSLGGSSSVSVSSVAGGSAGGGAAASLASAQSEPALTGPTHAGEWRDGSGRYHCALDEDSAKDSKFLCKHGRVIPVPHWSCCGAKDEAAAGCEGGEQSPPSAANNKAPASLPLLLRCISADVYKVLSGPREAPLSEWGGTAGVFPGNVVEALPSSRVVVDGHERLQLFDGSGWVTVKTASGERLFEEARGLDALPRELPEVVSSALHPHPLRRNLHKSFGCDGKDSKFGCRAGMPRDASRFPFSYCMSYTCRDCDFDLCHSCAVESVGVQAPVLFQSQHHPHVLTKKSPSFYKGGKYSCDLLKKGMCVCGSAGDKVRFQGFTWNCRTCKYDHCAECVQREFSEQRATLAGGGGGGGSSAALAKLSLSRTRSATSPAEARFNLLVRLNASLVEALPLVNLLLCDPSTGAGAVGHGGAASLPLARLLSTCRELLFSGLRDPVWTRALAATEVPSDSKFNLQLSRSRSAKYAAMGLPDSGGRWTIFSQAFRQIHPMSARGFRRGNQTFKVIFAGLHSIDAGGPYRESFALMWQELQSPQLSLLIPCPNAIETNGTDRDCWRLNPSATSAVELEMFAFMGKLLGLAIRGKNYVPLALAPLMWKLIIGETPALDDLKGVDLNKIKSMLEVKHIETKEGVTADTFSAVFPDLFFTTIDPSGSSEVEVVPGGAQRAVTFENRGEYVDAVMRYKIHEYDTQVRAVRQGLGTIVPLHTLCLLTHDAVERLVCGNPEVDLALLKRCCEYDGCRPDDPHIVYFWQVLSDFSQEERSMFLRFVWGRARLPLSEAEFTQRFKIANFRRSPADSFLPASHTCFFTLDLPTYSSVETCAKRLRYAIYNCTEVDGDDGGTGSEIASLGWEE